MRMRSFFVFLLISLFVIPAYGQAKLEQNPVEADSASVLSRPGLQPDTVQTQKPYAGSGVESIQLDAAKIEDLAVLGKVWGFLKYHHPIVTAGNYNWDNELFQIMPAIMAATSPVQRNAILKQWVDGLGTFDVTGYIPPAAPLKHDPDLAWIESRTLGIYLSKTLKLIAQARRNGPSFYIGQAQVGNPIFQNEDPYTSMTYPDAGYRLLALYRYWSVIQYFSPNRHLMGENWNSIMTDYVPRFFNAANELEYKLTALSLIGRIHDTHANVWGVDAAINTYRGNNAAVARVTFVEDKAVVTGFWKPLMADPRGLRVGDVIETIDGRAVADIVNGQLEYSPASNLATQLRDISTYLLRTNGSSINVGFRRDGELRTARVRTYPRETVIDLDLVYHRPIAPFSVIGTDIGYFYPGNLREADINSIIQQVPFTRGLIVDWRCYPLDFVATNLLPYLVAQPTPYVKISKGDIATPGRFTLSDNFSFGGFNSNPYQGKIVILVNEVSQSSAEFHSLAFRAVPGAVVIGSTTAGADGNISYFYLPGNIRTAISGLGIYYPNGQETQRVGIVPDQVVRPTIQGVKEGRDELVERAIEIINSN